jgi:disulfide bond formation protein DsbB
MDPTTSLITTLFGLGVLGAQLAFVLGVVLYLTKRFPETWLRWLRKHGILLGALVALGAMLGSLYYSEIVGFPVCKLCWLQRIAIYPLALILGLAWWRDDREIWRYAVPIAGFGVFFAIWHYLLQKTGSELFSCGTDPSAVSCGIQYINEFGYITFPLMGITTLVLAGTLAFIARERA